MNEFIQIGDLPDPIEPELIEIDASPTPVYVPVSDDDMPF